VALARQVIGAGTELYVDATAGIPPGRRCGRAPDGDYHVTWFEEPVSSQDLAGLAAVRSQVLPDVAAGELQLVAGRFCAADRGRGGGLLATRPDPLRRISEFMRGAALAAAHSMQVSAHCAPTLHAHVGAATANLRHVEYFHDHQRIERLLFDGALDAHGGVLTPDPGRPGLGIQLRAADAEQYRRFVRHAAGIR